MGNSGKKAAKAQRAKKASVKGLPVNDLPVKNATGVKGGRSAIITVRKAGSTPQE